MTKQKLDLERTMNELGKAFPEKSDQKIFFKKRKFKVKTPHMNKIPIAKKSNLVPTTFSHSTLKLE